VDNLADDVTLEGSMLDGAVQGADAVRTLVGGARQLSSRTTPLRFAAGSSGPST
jgi:hypothetical protein